MKKTLMDLYGSGILFFYYIKWPVLIGLPVMYLEVGYKQNIIMNVIWVYCLYLVLAGFYRRFVLKQRCDNNSCK